MEQLKNGIILLINNYLKKTGIRRNSLIYCTPSTIAVRISIVQWSFNTVKKGKLIGIKIKKMSIT
jgi:hypothetical protein